LNVITLIEITYLDLNCYTTYLSDKEVINNNLYDCKIADLKNKIIQ